MRKCHLASTLCALVSLSHVTACALEGGGTHDVETTLLSTTAHIRALHEAKTTGASIPLDIRDITQRRFVESRLRYAGKTPENSPNLFARIRRNSLVAELGPTKCANPLSVRQDTEDPDKWIARVSTTCFDGAEYSYLDLFWWNTDTNEILAFTFTEDFENPTDLVLEYPARATELGPNIQVDSFAVNSKGLEDYYVFEQHIQVRSGDLQSTDKIFAPTDSISYPDGIVTACIARDNGGCDYHYPAPEFHILLPLQMSFRFPRRVQSIFKAVAQVHMMDTGGVCQSADLVAHTSFDAANVTLDTKGPVDFGVKCVGDQARVRLWVKIVAHGSDGKLYSMFWANDLPPDSPDHDTRFPLQFVWSCLAEGSKITMADGSEKRIEEVGLGERVRSGGPGEWLSVVDISTGYESAPIVDLETEHGDALLVTQGHPLFDASGRPMRADELSVGSLIQTHRGPAKVTKLERKPYAGKVYNLKLGTEHQIAGQNVGAIHMFANGLRVGDSRSQWALSLARTQEAKQAPLPLEWRRDHLMHQVRRVLGP